MDTLEAICTRRSVRQYRHQPVADDVLQRLLEAAMAAPSARNAQPWHFVVLTERALLDRIARANPNAEMASRAPAAILVCADLNLELSPGYWVVDCAAATENLLLAAHALGLGAVWTGVYPRQERMAGFQQLLQLPERVQPHSLVVLGYPADRLATVNRFRPDRIHRNSW